MIRSEREAKWQHISRWKKKTFASSMIVCLVFLYVYGWHQIEFAEVSRNLLANNVASPELSKPLKILALGGSITWGSMLGNPSASNYATLLGNKHFSESIIHNEAIRATSASYFSLCIQSIIEGTANFVSVEDSNKRKEDAENEPYDVILLEFAINGLAGTDLLLRRLRQRYPGAVIIFINLYSLRGGSEALTRVELEAIQETETILYNFYPDGAHMTEHTADTFTKSLFAIDNHHLSETGHFYVSKKLKYIILEELPKRRGKEGGTWGNGDTCYFWGKTGMAHPNLQMSGGSMKRLDHNKISYEIFDRAFFNYSLPEAVSTSNDEVPIYLTHMTKGNPSIYPKMKVVLNGHEEKELDPLYPHYAKYHVSKSTIIGASKAGANTLTLENLESDKEAPFRLWGLSVCPACSDFGKASIQIDTTHGLV